MYVEEVAGTHEMKACQFWRNLPFGDRLAAGQRTLNPLTVVRIHVPEPEKISVQTEVFSLATLSVRYGRVLVCIYEQINELYVKIR